MAKVLRANSLAGEMGDTVELLGLTNNFANLSMTTAQGHQSYVVRLPRRAFSCIEEHSIPPQAQRKQHVSAPQAPRQPREVDIRDALAAAAVPSLLSKTLASSRLTPLQENQQAFKRPSMPSTPQRSYSVMDVEPVPLTHLPGVVLTLPDLPAELHYAIFGLLDPIDSACLGLASRQFYAIHRHLHRGEIPLGARREGPNDMEWVWRHAGPFVSGSSGGSESGNKQNTLAVLSPRGQIYCRKCRTARCELHKHIRNFFPEDQEYCEVSQKFGRKADEDARPVCYRSSPRHPHRCGRHTRQQRAVRLV